MIYNQMQTLDQYLSVNAVIDMMMGKKDKLGKLVQIYNVKCCGNLTAFFMSDGKYCVHTFLAEDDSIEEGVHQFAIIQVFDYYLAKTGNKVGLINFRIVQKHQKLIGNPHLYTANIAKSSEKTTQQQLYSQSQQKVQKQLNNHITTPKNIKHQHINCKIKKQSAQPILPFPGILQGDIKQIKDLQVGYMTYSIVCKILSCNFEESSVHASNGYILQMQLVDQSGVIEGVAFQQYSRAIRDKIKVNCVYKISKGIVAVNSYNNTSNKSKLKIIFRLDSIFQEVNIQLKWANKHYITISQLRQKPILQLYDVVAVLVRIDEKQQRIKDGRVLLKRNWIVADPDAGLVIDVVVWNDKIHPDYGLIGRSIYLNKFLLSTYLDNPTLNCQKLSTIQPASNSPYTHLQPISVKSYKYYNNISKPNEKPCEQLTIKELLSAIDQLQQSDKLQSQLNLWITKMVLYNRSKEIGEMRLGMDMGDAWGSLHLTVHDHHCRIIFKQGYGHLLRQLERGVGNIQVLFDKFLYQQYKVRIITKKFSDGGIAHILSHLQYVSPQSLSSTNLINIKELLKQAKKQVKLQIKFQRIKNVQY